MYSQYQSYQPHSASTSTSTAVPAQQWNGNAWVNVHAPNSGTNSTYTSSASPFAAPTSAPAPVVPPPTKKNPQLSTTYTQYYHGWHRKATMDQQLAQSLHVGVQREEALKNAQWSEYYAQQSSAAAHYYAGTFPGTAAPPLPPAPPDTRSSTTYVSPVVQNQNNATQLVSQQQQPPHHPQQSWSQRVQGAAPPTASQSSARWDSAPSAATPVPAPSPSAPGGMKNYVHRCLAQCTTAEQRTSVQKQVERVISKAIQGGTMHTMNWEAVDIVPIPGQPSIITEPLLQDQLLAKKPRVAEKSNSSYYGPPATHHSPLPHESYHTSNLHSQKQNTSYYGNNNSTNNNRNNLPTKDTCGSNRNDTSSYGGKNKFESELPENDSYYGKSKGASPKTTFKPDNKYSYYGNAIVADEEDFMALPGFKQKKHNKRKYQTLNVDKQQHKLNGFERNSSAMEKRANRFSQKSGDASAMITESMERYMGKAVIGGSTKKLDEIDYENMTVKGTCQTFDKEYLRLTAPPRAELVRPKAILEQHLKNLKDAWKQITERKKYSWFCSQFKALRQDLTVQRINDAFAVDTYETHARIALEEGDLNEYNQCQTQLKELYDCLVNNEEALKNRNEFIAYRIIYYVFLTGNEKYDGGSSDLFKIMLFLSRQQQNDSAIAHALKVRTAVAEYDYHSFFRLQDTCPNIGAYLMEFLVKHVRHWALQRISKAYKPSVPVDFVLAELGFDLNESSQVEEGKEWLSSCGCVLSDDGKTLVTKDSVVRESNLTQKSSLI